MFGHEDKQFTPPNDHPAVPAVMPNPVPDATLESPLPDSLSLPPVSPSAGGADPFAPAAPAPSVPSLPTGAPLSTDDLMNLKQQALQQLTPLVGHLEQTPEEKFRTTMMMIQAADDQSLLQAAYSTAQTIPDEKARAQALLDVVNEINYFTSHGNPPEIK